MKWSLPILALVLPIIGLVIYECSSEKEIQVRETLWTLIDKNPVYRYEEPDLIRLVWIGRDGIKRIEDRPISDSTIYKIGMKLVNRDPK